MYEVIYAVRKCRCLCLGYPRRRSGGVFIADKRLKKLHIQRVHFTYSKGSRQTEKTTYPSSQCHNDEQTSALEFLDEFTKSEFFHIRMSLGFSIPCSGLENG